MWGPPQTDDGVPYVQTGRRRPLVASSRLQSGVGLVWGPTCIKDRSEIGMRIFKPARSTQV